MAGLIPQHFIDDLLSRVDIVEVIDKRVKLRKTGKNYSACCPFHQEKTPSFSVEPDKVMEAYRASQGKAGGKEGEPKPAPHHPLAVLALRRVLRVRVPMSAVRIKTHVTTVRVVAGT